MENITVIIPLQDYIKECFGKAIKSVSNSIEQILVIGADDMLKQAADEIANDKRIKTINSNGLYDFANLINLGIDACESEYFAILGCDDEFTDIWEKNLDIYFKAEPDVCVYLPMIAIEDSKTQTIAGLGNEIAWASAFCQEIGKIDNECLKSYMGFYINGGVFRTKDIKEIGYLKPSFKAVATYEFLLRLTYQSKSVIVMPKLCCKHTFGFNKEHEEKLTQEEMDWLIKTAQKEMFFKEDRNVKFERKEEKKD